ncbi:MAG: PEP/pyruvate-binding domain-containing protein [Deltaproteobacteria bacterium]|nr:PEP/pyruvate-binding domain-containing protein [Deltaproteobacteria bacterium]
MKHRARWTLPLTLLALTQCTPPRPATVQIAQTNPRQNSGGVIIQQAPPTIPGDDAGTPVDASGSPGRVTADGDFLPRIDNETAWNALAARRERDNSAHTDTVKVVIDLSDGQVYFLQTRRWEIHYFFIRRFLGRPGLPIPDAETFWRREYLANERRFVQASLVHYRDQNVWAFELIAQDVYAPDRSMAAFERVRDRLYFGRELRFHAIASQHLAAIDTIRARIPVVTTNELFANTHYQALNTGEAYGYLRFHTTAPTPATVRRTDLVVLSDVPLDLPVCSGVITAQLQTPLSHIAILSANRGTPNMALRDAMTNTALRALDGRLVRLRVTGQEWSVEAATQQDAERSWASRRPSVDFTPELDERFSELRSVSDLRRTDVRIAGAKAAQLGEVARIRNGGFRVPPGFVVPFSAYLAHMRSDGIQAELQGYLRSTAFSDNPEARQQALTNLRAHIRRAPVDPALLRAVRARIAQIVASGHRVRLRSSTNAEDLEGFNGAGLYSSTAIPAAFTDAQLADGLREVWSSVWNYQAYEERSYFRIAQPRVAMAVLVQESVDGAAATGVAITGNPFDANRPGHFINAQVRDEGVTSASNGEIPEQLFFYTYPPPGFIERLSTSSRNGGRTILSDPEVRSLSSALSLIHSGFIPGGNWLDGRAMDIEFLVTPAREMIIVQARPYRIVWDTGRQYSTERE